MWTYEYIDKQLKFRLASNSIKIDITERSFTGGLFTHIYWFKGEQILAFNRYPDGSIGKNNFSINPNLNDDPKEAVEFGGRARSWGKRLVLAKCGKTDMEKFNYISELLYQVIEQLS